MSSHVGDVQWLAITAGALRNRANHIEAKGQELIELARRLRQDADLIAAHEADIKDIEEKMMHHDETGYHFDSIEEMQAWVQRWGPLPDDTPIWVGEEKIR